MKTTKKQYDQFKKWCQHYERLFGLIDWTIYYDWRKQGDMQAPDSGAQVHCNWGARIATVSLNKNVDGGQMCDGDAKRWACHEMLHIVLSGGNYIGGARYLAEGELEAAHESEVVRLTNIIRGLE